MKLESYEDGYRHRNIIGTYTNKKGRKERQTRRETSERGYPYLRCEAGERERAREVGKRRREEVEKRVGRREDEGCRRAEECVGASGRGGRRKG